MNQHNWNQLSESTKSVLNKKQLQQAYQSGYRQALNEGLGQPSDPNWGIGAPGLQPDNSGGGQPPQPPGGGVPWPDGPAPKWQFGDDWSGSTLINLLSQIWGEGWWAQWEQIWNNPNWTWYGWTESPYGGYMFNMPGSDMVFTVEWHNTQGWVFGMMQP